MRTGWSPASRWQPASRGTRARNHHTVDDTEGPTLSAASGQLDVPEVAAWSAARPDPRHGAATALQGDLPVVLSADAAG